MLKNLPASARDTRDSGLIPGIKDPWGRTQQLTPEFLPGESRGQRSLVGYSPEVGKESDTTEMT